MIDLKQSYRLITWDIGSKLINVSYFGKKNDSGRGIKVKLVQNSISITPTTETLRIYLKKPDNTNVYIDAAINSDYFEIALTNQVYAVPGTVYAELQLKVGDLWITSDTFDIPVFDNLVDSSIESSDDFVALQTALNKVDGLYTAEKTELDNLELDYSNKAADLENTYAPRLTGIESQLAAIPTQTYITEKAKTVDVNNLLTLKANQTSLDTTNATVSSNYSALDTKINSQASGSPKGTYTTVTALSIAFPTGNSNIYVVTDDGKWYYWNGSTWTAGGIYQATGTSDSIIKNKTFANIDARFEEIESDSFLPITNLLINGDFSGGSTGWTSSGNNNVMTITDKLIYNGVASAYAGYYQDISIPTGNKIALIFNYSNDGITKPAIQLCDFGAFTNLSAMTYAVGSNVIITTAKTNGIRLYFQQVTGVTYTNALIDNVLVLDLTATYGVGNEPTINDVNSLMDSIPNRWFSGSANRFNAKNITSQIKIIKNISQTSSDNTYNVKDYGAKGDGITDDTSAIQSTINAANTASGGTVYFPKGTFLVSATLIVYSNINLLGQSRWNSIIQLSVNSMVALFDCSGTSSAANKNITFENLHLKHSLSLSGSPTNDGKGVLIYAKYTMFCQVNRCVLSDFTFAAIYLNYTTDTTIWAYSWQIHNNIFQGNITTKQISTACYYGIWLDQQSEYVDISSNQFFYMQSAVYMTDSPNHRINNNTMDMCNDAVKHTAVAYKTNGKLVITNNTINHCYNSGINIQVMCNIGNQNALQSGCIISNNIILLPYVQGIKLEGGLGHICTGNKVITSNNGDKGIVLKDYNASNLLSYCMVTTNVVQSNISGGTGIIDSSGVTGTGNSIINNILVTTP